MNLRFFLFQLQLSAGAEVTFHNHQLQQFFALIVAELRHVFVSMTDNFFCLFGMVDVEAELLLKVRKVFFHLHIVIIGYQRPFHKPSLTRGARHDCQ